MEYYVVREEFLDILEIEVNKRIKDGWEPLGGVCVSEVLSGVYFATKYCQAMIKKEK